MSLLGYSSACIIPTLASLAEFRRRSLTSSAVECDSTLFSPSNVYAASYPANQPIEDRSIRSSTNKLTMAGVLDGHGGWQVAEYVSKRIEDELLLHLEGTDFEDEWLVEEKIQQGFSNIEQSYLEKVKDSFGLGYGEVAKVGCCVLVAFRSASRLALANAGDCRAILASQVTDSDQTLALRITNDHNCREPLEDLGELQLQRGGGGEWEACTERVKLPGEEKGGGSMGSVRRKSGDWR